MHKIIQQPRKIHIQAINHPCFLWTVVFQICSFNSPMFSNFTTKGLIFLSNNRNLFFQGWEHFQFIVVFHLLHQHLIGQKYYLYLMSLLISTIDQKCNELSMFPMGVIGRNDFGIALGDEFLVLLWLQELCISLPGYRQTFSFLKRKIFSTDLKTDQISPNLYTLLSFFMRMGNGIREKLRGMFLPLLLCQELPK